MPYQHLADGLYLLKQRSTLKPVDHYGVLDVGNRLRLIHAGPSQPVVVHQTPPAITTNWIWDTGSWLVIGKVQDETRAIARLHRALRDPTYDVFGNNCEQFARFVATGVRESTQLRAAVVLAGIAGLACVAYADAP